MTFDKMRGGGASLINARGAALEVIEVKLWMKTWKN